MSGINLGKTPAMIVALVIGIIMTTTAILPLVSDYSEAKTFKNEGRGQYAFITGEDSYSLEWKYADPTNVIVNGVKIEGVSGNDALAMGNFTVRIWPNVNGYAQLIMANNETGITANVSDSKDFTFTYANGQITVSNGAASKTFESAGFYAIVPENGTHTMKFNDQNVYINDNTPLLVMGITGVGSQWDTGYLVEGTITDYTVSQWTGTIAYAPANITDDSVKISGYTNLYSIKQFQWTIDNNGTPQTVTYNYFLIPYEVTAEPDNPETYKALMKVVPLMAFIMLIVAAAAMIINKRD